MEGPAPSAGPVPGSAPPRAGPKWTSEAIISVRRWTPTLWSFRTTRPEGLAFTPGHYGRLGLEGGDEAVWRPFSFVSPPEAAHLEFLAVLVPGGAFSGRLAALGPGDPVLVERSAYGFLTLGQLAPGPDLWLLATGSGLGPFVSILRTREAWERFERIVLVHGVRLAGELAYRDEIAAACANPPFDAARARLTYLPVVTREPGATPLAGRIPALLADGRLEAAAGAPLDAARSRALVCGNPAMAQALRQGLGARGLRPGRRGVPGQVAFEQYWDERR